jgi:hypothetical protein
MTRRSLLVGQCVVSLYPLKLSDVDVLKQALVSQSTSHAQWHALLGHPSTQVVRFVMRVN